MREPLATHDRVALREPTTGREPMKVGVMYTFTDSTDTDTGAEFGSCHSCASHFTEDDGSGDGNPVFGFTRSGKGICESCADSRWSFAYCCDVYVKDIYYDSYNDMCQRCVNENYFMCDSCDQLVSNDYYSENGMCVECYDDEESRNGIHGYHAGAPWGKVFHTLDGVSDDGNEDRTLVYFGIEFECEDIGREYVETLRTLESGQYAHAESDGSLMNGFEVITEPATYGEWKTGDLGRAMRQFHADMLDQGANFGAHTVGAHVHVSRVAFADDNHLARFAIFGTHNVEYMRALSGRTSYERYAHLDKYLPRQFGNAIKRRRDDRSRWCNLTNKETVEVRLFAGSNTFDDYLAHIEFVSALIEYTRDLSANDCLVGALLSQSFTQYLADSHYTLAHKLAMSRVPVSHLM